MEANPYSYVIFLLNIIRDTNFRLWDLVRRAADKPVEDAYRSCAFFETLITEIHVCT